MRLFFSFLLFALFSIWGALLSAQTQVRERTVTIDSATGKTTVTTTIIEKTEEDITPYTNMINSTPLDYYRAFDIRWMHRFGSHIAAGIGGEAGTTEDAGAATAEIRFYTNEEALHGFYIAPIFSYISGVSNDFDTANLSFFSSQFWTFGILTGWQWFPTSHFSLGAAIGLNFYFPIGDHTSKNYFSLIRSYGSDGTPVARFDIGYAW
ncbi:MAG TPA: hypothetical protein VGM92_13645 [Candidatus Kapabacteria bacterium]|jgi:hypothetical protein